ncbi:MAG: PEP-CTERM sorting domain-containing protein [Opitutaceae bacterium]|jgi:autotransporter-associated beta strand protein|nr:PEP-CTERM sorting domain-containing protein [Opitutaceae bacterium]
MNTLHRQGLAIAGILIASQTPLSAADFTWNSSTSANWSAEANWLGGSVPSGSDAVIKTPAQYGTLVIDRNDTVAGFDVSLTSDWVIYSPDTGTTTLEIANLNKSGSRLRFRDSGSGGLRLTIGTVSLTGGNLDFGQENSASQLTSLTVTGKTVITSGYMNVNAKSATFDEVNLSGGNLAIYAYAKTGGPVAEGGITVRGLSGTGGQIYAIYASNRYIAGKLTIDGKAGDVFSYGGKLVDRGGGTGGEVTLSVFKTGAGIQKLGGANTYSGTTGINNGVLVVNGTHSGAGKYTVSGTGTLAGAGTITTTDADIVIEGGGKLSAGDAGIGKLTLALGTGKLDLTQAGDASLAFTLGVTASGTAVSLTSGIIDIGDGNIDLDSFSFTFAEGFGAGDYTLLASTGSITGTLGANLTGVLNGHEATLALSGDNTSIILSVGAAIPEPSTFALFAGVCILVLVTSRRRLSRP